MELLKETRWIDSISRLRIREGNYNRTKKYKKKKKKKKERRRHGIYTVYYISKRDVHPTLSTLAVMIDIIYICNQPPGQRAR